MKSEVDTDIEAEADIGAETGATTSVLKGGHMKEAGTRGRGALAGGKFKWRRRSRA